MPIKNCRSIHAIFLTFFMPFFMSLFTSMVYRSNAYALDNWAESSLKIQHLMKEIHNDYGDADHYLDVLLLSLLTEQNTLVFGGPGGAKTQLAQRVLRGMEGKTFTLQFSPSTKQEQLIGAAKGKEYLEKGHLEYVTEQSLLKHSYGILDEIDKANPEILSSALSVLLERKAMLGDQEIAGNLQTAILTSNMNVDEFLQKFKNTQDGPTGSALLDRVLFKTVVFNRLSTASKLFQTLEGKKQAETEVEAVNPQSLSQRLKQMNVPIEVQQLAFLMWMELSKTEELSSTGTCQFSTRGAMNLIEVMKASKFLAALRANLGQDPLELPWGTEDLIHVQRLSLLQGPGKWDNPKALNKLRQNYLHDPRTLKMIDQLQTERKIFQAKMQKVLNTYEEELAELSRLGMDQLMNIVQGKNLATFNLATLNLSNLNLSTLNSVEKTKILQKVRLLEQEIKMRSEGAEKRKEGFAIQEVARGKVSRILAEVIKLLKLDQNQLNQLNQLPPNFNVEEKTAVQTKTSDLEEMISEIQQTPTRTRTYDFSKTFTQITKVSKIPKVLNPDRPYFTPSGDKILFFSTTYPMGSDNVHYEVKTDNGRYQRIPDLDQVIHVLDRSASGKIVTAHEEQQKIGHFIKVWDSQTMHPLYELARFSSKGNETKAKFSPDEEILVLCPAFLNYCDIYQGHTGKKLATIPEISSIRKIEFTPDGKTLILLGENKEVNLWDPFKGQFLFSFKMNDVKKMMVDTSLSKDGKFITAVYESGEVNVYNIKNGALTSTFTLPLETSSVEQVEFNPQQDKLFVKYLQKYFKNGKLVSLGKGKDPELWDLTTKKPITSIYEGQTLSSVFKFSPSGRHLLISDGSYGNGSIQIWDTSKGNLIKKLDFPVHQFNHIEFSDDEKYFVVVSDPYGSVLYKTTSD